MSAISVFVKRGKIVNRLFFDVSSFSFLFIIVMPVSIHPMVNFKGPLNVGGEFRFNRYVQRLILQLSISYIYVTVITTTEIWSKS